MKETLVTVAFHIKSLYIPHGSDESVIDSEKYNNVAVFISHMVQMKVPPGFGEEEEVNRLYIPHGSDESSIYFQRQYC